MTATLGGRPGLEVAEVLRQYGEAFRDRYGGGLSAAQRKALRDLAACAAEFDGVEVFVLPSFPVLAAAQELLAGSSVRYGAQDAHWEERGAYTGCVSPAVLRELGCTFVEVGHAERRRLFGLPRSSWADYDPALISEGGGVFPRTLKSIQVTEPVRRALGLADDVVSLETRDDR